MLGAENVYLIYRRSEKEMPARDEKRLNMQGKKRLFKLLTNQNRKEWPINKVKCMELGT